MNILEFLKENKHDEWIQFFNLDDDDILTYENLLNIFEGNIDNINYSKPPKPKTNETYLPWLQSLMIIIISFILPYIIIKYVFMNKKGRKKKGGKSRKRLRRRRR
jgi:phosphotransferase system  glucose/maltose/N-acetylglucosamine-specific IIC component